MNYNSVILVGVLAITAFWWVVQANKNYPGPKVMTMYINDDQPVTVTPAQATAIQEEHKHQ